MVSQHVCPQRQKCNSLLKNFTKAVSIITMAGLERHIGNGISSLHMHEEVLGIALYELTVFHSSVSTAFVLNKRRNQSD